MIGQRIPAPSGGVAFVRSRRRGDTAPALLADGRLTVLTVRGGVRVHARATDPDGTEHQLGLKGTWWCACRRPGCVHLAALRLVVDVP